MKTSEINKNLFVSHELGCEEKGQSDYLLLST